MDRQIIDISGDGVTLRKSRGSMQVVQKDEDGETHKTLVPFDEIEALMLHGRYGNYSHELLLTLAEKAFPSFCATKITCLCRGFGRWRGILSNHAE